MWNKSPACRRNRITVFFAVAQTAGYQLCLGKGASYVDAKTIEVSQPVSQFRRKLCRQFWASMILIGRSGAGQSIVGGVALAPFISEEIGAISGPVFEEGRIGFVRAYQFDIVALCEHFGRPRLGGRAPSQIGLKPLGDPPFKWSNAISLLTVFLMAEANFEISIIKR